MRASYLPVIVLGTIWLCLLVYLVSSAGELPDHVATHFDFSGQPNGWMTRSSCVISTAVLGFVLPTFIVGLFFAMRFFPNSAFNLPRRDYWLAPERRAATLAYLFRQSFWLASMMAGLAAVIHGLTIQANRQGGALPHLSAPMAFALVGCLVVGVAVWSICLYRHFK